MPIYEFACMECEEHFDALLRMSDAEPACPACGGSRVRRQLSVFAAGSSSPGPSAAGGSGCACGGACACRH